MKPACTAGSGSQRRVMKQTEYFSANNSYDGFTAHQRAEEFLSGKRKEGFNAYQSTYGNYGFSVTYWKEEK
jgi:hypothetical protein